MVADYFLSTALSSFCSVLPWVELMRVISFLHTFLPIRGKILNKSFLDPPSLLLGKLCWSYQAQCLRLRCLSLNTYKSRFFVYRFNNKCMGKTCYAARYWLHLSLFYGCRALSKVHGPGLGQCMQGTERIECFKSPLQDNVARPNV